MPIKTACSCGKQFLVKDDFAGKTVKCPGCGQPLTIPRPQASQSQAVAGTDGGLSDLLAEAGLKQGIMRCPGCGSPLPDHAVLCVQCGYDLRKGYRMKTRVGAESELDEEEFADLPVHGVHQLDKAERDIARDLAQQRKLGKGVPWWVVFLALLGVVGFTVAMVSMPQDRVMETSGIVLVVVGGLGAFFFGLRLLIIAFGESFLCGILYIFVPFYALYYIGSRWDKCGGLFLCGLGCSGIQLAGYVLLVMAPWVQGESAIAPSRPAAGPPYLCASDILPGPDRC